MSRIRTTKNQRRLRLERLESRQLFSADVHIIRHNVYDAEDVNDDGQITAGDALAIINAMHRHDGGDAAMLCDVNNDGIVSAVDALDVIHRLNRGVDILTPQRRPLESFDSMPGMPTEVRSIDGSGNNLGNALHGSTGQPLIRMSPIDYSDGISTPAGADRPSAREISNHLSNDNGVSTHNERGVSAFVYIWGQFIDHDISLTEPQKDGESFAIEVPSGDLHFDPTNSGTVTIPFMRSQFDPSTGTSLENPRTQFNAITSYIDGSMVYGSDSVTSENLRTFTGGRMTIGDNGLLPMDDKGEVIAGDIRASENISLTSIHTLFVREHNFLANKIAVANPELSDEEIFQQARAIVIAEIQAITFNEFLPAVLGDRSISNYDGYDPTVDPSVAHEFSTAAFRFGHSTLNDHIEFLDNDGRSVQAGVTLAQAFNRPVMLEETGIDAILKFDSSIRSMELDLQVVDSLRNMLFGAPGSGGMDLVALNIQRGRDHGLADYNATRVAYGFAAAESFADITSDTGLQDKLEATYGSVNNIDLWIGLLAEDDVVGGSIGPLAVAIIADQFKRLRNGDRLWYENVFVGDELLQLQRTSLADVIERNTTVVGLQQNVFFMLPEIRGSVLIFPSDPEQLSPRSGVPGVTVELLDGEGDVIASTITDEHGDYRFRSFVATGDFKVRLADTGATIDVLVSGGGSRLRGIDFDWLG